MATNSSINLTKQALLIEAKPKTSEMSKENSQKGVPISYDLDGWTLEEHMSHILALKRLTNTKLKNVMKNRGIFNFEASHTNRKLWGLAHRRVTSNHTRGHGSYTIKPEIWATLRAKDYPYSKEDYQTVLYNIARKDNIWDKGVRKDFRQWVELQDKHSKKRSNPAEDLNETINQTKKRKVEKTFANTGSPALDTSQEGNDSYQHLSADERSLQIASLQKSAPEIVAAKTTDIQISCSDLGATSSQPEKDPYSHPSIGQSSGSEQASQIQTLATRISKLPLINNQTSSTSRISNEKINSEDPKPSSNEKFSHATTQVQNSSLYGNSTDDIPKAAVLPEPKSINTRRIPKGHAMRGRDWHRSLNFARNFNSSGSSRSSSIRASKPFDFTEVDTSIQLPVVDAPQKRAEIKAEGQTKSVKVTENSKFEVQNVGALGETVAKLGASGKALQLKAEQCQQLQSALEETKEGLRVVSETFTVVNQRLNDFKVLIEAKDRQIQALKDELNEMAIGKDREIEDLKEKLKEANGTVAKWAEEDEERVRGRREQVKP